MAIKVSQFINASSDEVWKTITDIENYQHTLSSVLKIDIIEKPDIGLTGLKWKETRKMFGKEATETMWITGAQEGKWYETKAVNAGCEYKTQFNIENLSTGVNLSIQFEAKAKTLLAILFSPLGFLFSGMLKKAFQQDLQEIKKRIESRSID